jgi:hypothetical protein
MNTLETRDHGAVVVLGALFAGRYPSLLPAAAARGLTILAIDAPTPFKLKVDAARRADPGHPLAGIDDLVWIGGDRHEDVTEQVLAWTRQHRVRGVLAFGEDFVEAAGLVTDLLGLPSPGLRASRVCRNKHLQRRYLSAWSPRALLLPPGDDQRLSTVIEHAWRTFPAVLKPVGREASSGVQRVDDVDALATALGEYDATEPLLLEELVSGHEVSVEALVQDGHILFASVTGKLTNEADSDFFVEMGHTVPDPQLGDETRAAVLATNRAVLERLAFSDGIAHAEYRIGADGRAVLMELAARAPGDSIVSLYHLATGEPMEAALLDIAIGERATYPAPSRFARQVYVPHRPGVLRDVSVDGLAVPVTWLPERWAWPDVHATTGNRPGRVHMVVSGRSKGDELSAVRQSGDRLLMYVIDAPTARELDAMQEQCDRLISVQVDGQVDGGVEEVAT